jgi:hypothetical protein
MKVSDIKKIDPNILPKEFLNIYNQLKKETEDFNEEYIYLDFEQPILEFLKQVKKFVPESIKTKKIKAEKPASPDKPPIDFEDDSVVANVMKDYNLSKEKAIKLIELRKEAVELKKENIEKLIDKLDKSEFYQGKNYISKSNIDKGKTRDLQKDSKQMSLTKAEELKMTGTPYKRISKKGAKNQFGTTEGGKVYYEYRQNRRDVDKEIRLKKGGLSDLKNPKILHLPYEIAVYVPSTKNVSQTISATELSSRVKEVEKFLAETFGGFTSSQKTGGYVSNSTIITEKVVPVTAFCSLIDFKNNKQKLINKISFWSMKWGQEAMGFEFEGDLYYVPQKLKTGGRLKSATYIPNKDIKSLTTVWGNNIRGKEILDGAYTTRKNLKTEPKMARTMFEDEMFEFNEGGGVPNEKYKVVKVFRKSGRREVLEKNLTLEEARRVVERYPNSNTSMVVFMKMYSKGGSTYQGGGELKGKFIAEINVPYNYERVVQDEFEFTEFLSKTLTKKWFGNGVWKVKIVKPLFETNFRQKIVVEIDIPIGVTQGGALDEFEVIEFLSKTLTKKWFGNGVWSVEITSGKFARGGKTNPKKTFKKKVKKVEPKMARTMFEDEMFEYEKGGRIDLFEDYENIPAKIKNILDKYSEKYGVGSEMDYKESAKMLKEVQAFGYTFDYGLDNEPYGLRPKGVKISELRDYEDFDDEDESETFETGGKVEKSDFDSLKKGDKIRISYSSVMSGNSQAELIVKSKTRVLKGKSNEKEKICFINTKNKTGVKFYAYRNLKDNYIGFAIGDLAIHNVKILK